MSNTPQILTGTVQGDTIRLDKASGLPDGLHVRVSVEPLMAPTARQRELLEQVFGAWAGEEEELDRFLEETQQARRGR